MAFRARSAVATARQINLNQKRLKHETEQAAKLDRWCTEHDVDGNGKLPLQPKPKPKPKQKPKPKSRSRSRSLSYP